MVDRPAFDGVTSGAELISRYAGLFAVSYSFLKNAHTTTIEKYVKIGFSKVSTTTEK
ncbi:MAG TPA: hypothetical protein PK733_06025 [Clostridiales bacterium]|nr:hypothetical protein [Clostridiales bacterium]